MNMINRPHPGNILKKEVIEALDLTVSDVANRLGVSRASISRVINGRCAISYDLAVRLEAAGVSTARFWIALQSAYDLEQVQKTTKKSVIKNIVPIIENHNIANA